MELSDVLRLRANTRIAFVGAGGKTTAMFGLARQWEGAVWVTASTHLAVAQEGWTGFSGKESDTMRTGTTGSTILCE